MIDTFRQAVDEFVHSPVEVLAALVVVGGAVSAALRAGRRFWQNVWERLHSRPIVSRSIEAEGRPNGPATDVPHVGTLDQLNGPGVPQLTTALSLEDVLKIIKDPETTALQKSQFTQREEGRFVVWAGKARSVELMYPSRPDGEVLVVLTAATADPLHMGDLATAVFPNSEVSVLTQVHAGDVIVVEGKLKFMDLTGRWSVYLANSRFVRFQSRSSRR